MHPSLEPSICGLDRSGCINHAAIRAQLRHLFNQKSGRFQDINELPPFTTSFFVIFHGNLVNPLKRCARSRQKNFEFTPLNVYLENVTLCNSALGKKIAQGKTINRLGVSARLEMELSMGPSYRQSNLCQPHIEPVFQSALKLNSDSIEHWISC